MSPATIFRLHLVLGYVPWLLCFGAYVWPTLKAMDRIEAHRAIATLHSFRFFGLVFIIPGVVGPNLPADFATFAAYGDFATGVLAILALLFAVASSSQSRPRRRCDRVLVRIRHADWPPVRGIREDRKTRPLLTSGSIPTATVDGPERQPMAQKMT